MTTAPTPVQAAPTAPNAAAATGPAAGPAGPVPTPPSVHVRAVITWLAIFPLVAVGMMLLAPISESWHPVLRAFVLTLVVVPLAVYVVVPWLLRRHGALRRRRAPRSGAGA
jgi:antibiotic biosynthesis monooxygenase (ABM) superfamily enzyme